jgi:propane monooxygenase large subunit
MSDGLTLNKITSQRGISLGEAARRVADLGWTPSYVQEAMTFPTDYKISKAPRDPMKQVLRSYFPMQEEKDNRVYGALDAALRGDMFRNVQPRWVEWMKLFLAIIPFPEISAARSMAMLGRLAPGEELRTGFTMQMVDEFRHSTIQMNLKKWYMENYIDSLLKGSLPATPSPRRTCFFRWSLKRPSPTRCSSPCRRKPHATATMHCRRCSCRCSPTKAGTLATAIH